MKLVWFLLIIFGLNCVSSADDGKTNIEQLNVVEGVATNGTNPTKAVNVSVPGEDSHRSANLKLAPRIIGGRFAAPDEAPYIISLRIDNIHNCGGSIISPLWIVTAAHCVEHYGNYQVVAGSNDLFGGTYYNVYQIIPHPNHVDGFIYANDIALVQVVEQIAFGSNVQPIAYSRSEVYSGSTATLYGWGEILNDGPIPRFLKAIELTILSEDQCMASVYKYNLGQICTIRAIGQSACRGDSGGPLVMNNELIGLTSFGTEMCAIGQPDVFTKVSYYADWIDQYVR